MASVETPNMYEKFLARAKDVSRLISPFPNFWLPVERQGHDWVDIYTGNKISEPRWSPGFPEDNANKKCVIQSLESSVYVNWQCVQTVAFDGWHCSCHFPAPPFLTLRGLCKDSNIDQTYLPQNSPITGHLDYYGTVKTQAMFLRDEQQWMMKMIVFNTTATSTMATHDGYRFMLGKVNWTIEGDSKSCQKGRGGSYVTELKLTSCREGEFTCEDGQCVQMVERCNQVPDCRDESDERGCQLMILKDGYNKNIPPIRRAEDGSAIPANVSISITLMRVVEIEERHHSIHLQFEINLQWKENRVTYHNLKEETSLNALSNADISKLWLPLIIYDNTDQKDSTRLGWINEWLTRVSVDKEGPFSRSGINDVDEAEIFEGNENTLVMTQTYTHTFQCQYMLQKYPFDTQV